MDAGWSHALALCSDGQVEAFGQNNAGQCNVPPLPAGLRDLEADAFYLNSLLLRSDGALLHRGTTSGYSPVLLTQAPAGLAFVDIASGQVLAGAVLSDGSAEIWSLSGWSAPPLPPGVSYVEIDCGYNIGWLRRSDGEIVAFGSPAKLAHPEYTAPDLDPGQSYLELDAAYEVVAARKGPTCTYVSFHGGCAGSMASARLVPRDTPRIGTTFELRLFDLPGDVAILAMGFAPTTPLDLAVVGMPGCELAIEVDGSQALVGQGFQATWQLAIPDVPSLVGVRFYNQALVLDPQAPNSFGAVLSDAAEGVVGRR